MNKPKVQSIAAQLPCLDFEAAKHFYVDILDCILVGEFEDLLIFLMDDIEFHLWRCDDKNIPENSSIYLRVNAIDQLFEYYQKRLLGEVQIYDRPWGMREFYIIDPSGNLLKFGQKIE
ncbi:MAG: hypothetical protein DI539_00955 [Flavobacterium psychrophilum]|nr:MAG: hypothetical protein DI539_00955 [Flavobacterium psychrophilum]